MLDRNNDNQVYALDCAPQYPVVDANLLAGEKTVRTRAEVPWARANAENRRAYDAPGPLARRLPIPGNVEEDFETEGTNTAIDAPWGAIGAASSSTRWRR